MITAALLGAAVNAAVIAQRADGDYGEVWKGNGKIEGRFGDSTIDVECDPVEILKTLYDNCNDSGFCIDSWEVPCGTEGITVPKPLMVTVSIPQGQFNKDLRNPLIAGIIASVSWDAHVVHRWVDHRRANGVCHGSCT